MNRLTLQQLELHAHAYNRAVSDCAGIDSFCSRTEWVIPFHHSFMPGRTVYAWQEGASFILFAGTETADGRTVLTPLEPLWRFPSPLIGPDAPDMLAALLGCAHKDFDTRRVHVVMFGLPDSRPFLEKTAERASGRHKPFLLDPTLRCVASLEGGLDGFWERRNTRFRYNLRRALRKEQKSGISFERITKLDGNSLEKIYPVILDIEHRSWKGLSGQGADQPPMKEFYLYVLQRIAPAGMLRLVTALHDGEKIGYIYGAVAGRHFRGLQCSFDQRYAAWSLGNLLHYRMLEWMCEEGCLRYDMGMVVEYKKRWAEGIHTTQTMYLSPLSV